MLFAAYCLITLPSVSWVSAYPDSAFVAPPGPISLLDGFPNVWVMRSVEILLAVSFAALLVGFRVGWASVTATLLMTFGLGVTFSLGKIDHVVLLVFTPVMLAAAGWSGAGPVRQWVLRLWAFMIALSMLSAGLIKVMVGWLDPATQAVRGSATVFHVLHERSGPAAELLLQTDAAWLWEPMDVATVLMECGLVLAVWSWVWWRRMLALLCVFHLSVMLLIGIVFAANVAVYAAFVPWSRLPIPKLQLSGWLVAPVAAVAWLVPTDSLARWWNVAVVSIGAAVGIWHLASWLLAGYVKPLQTRWRGSVARERGGTAGPEVEWEANPTIRE